MEKFLKSSVKGFEGTSAQQEASAQWNESWAKAIQEKMPMLMKRAEEIQDLIRAAEEKSALLNADLARMEQEALKQKGIIKAA